MEENLNHLDRFAKPESLLARITTWASLLLLCVALEPYLEMEARLWFSTSKQNSAALIAFVGALWMLIGRRREVFGGKRLSAVWALFFTVASLGFLWLALLMDVRSGVALFSIFLLFSSLEFLFGFAARPSTFLAGGLLLATVPIPGGAMARVGQVLVETAATLSHLLLAPFYSGLELLGYSLVLPSGAAVEVVDDCNGLAGILLFPVLILILLAYWRVKKWKVALLFLILSFFAAFGGNLLRILLTAFFEFQGLSWNHSPVFHEILGLVSLGLFFVPLAWFLFKAKVPVAGGKES
jgi:exosortase/archaeosortase family protein